MITFLRGTGLAVAAVVLGLSVASCATSSGGATSPAAVEKKRAALREMRDKTLRDLYATKPEIKAEVESAVGYAVFDASQVNLVLYLGAEGAGMIVDNGDGRETFMSMTRAGTGPGVGYKTYRQLMVFKDRGLMETFKTVGADVGASADATFKTGGSKGMTLDGSTSFNPMLSVYQVTDSGMLLQANWGGVAYLPDSALNAK